MSKISNKQVTDIETKISTVFEIILECKAKEKEILEMAGATIISEEDVSPNLKRYSIEISYNNFDDMIAKFGPLFEIISANVRYENE